MACVCIHQTPHRGGERHGPATDVKGLRGGSEVDFDGVKVQARRIDRRQTESWDSGEEVQQLPVTGMTMQQEPRASINVTPG